MNMSAKASVLGVVVLALIILAGQGLLTTFNGDATISATLSDNQVEFSFESGYVTNYSAVALDNGEGGMPERYVACFDEDHEWFQPDGYIENTLTHLRDSMAKYGLVLEILGTDETTDILQAEVSAGESVTKVIFMTGSLPQELYNGTEDCTFIQWLSIGGNVVWGNGPIGMFISTAEGLDYVDSASVLLFGEAGAINFATENVSDNGVVYEHGLSNIIRCYYSDVTYGIRIGVLSEQLFLDYNHDGYAAVSITKYHAGSGSMTVFGGTVDNNTEDYVTQVLSSGLTYETKVLDYEIGKSAGATGTLATPGDNIKVFVTLGLMNDNIGALFDFSESLSVSVDFGH